MKERMIPIQRAVRPVEPRVQLTSVPARPRLERGMAESTHVETQASQVNAPAKTEGGKSSDSKEAKRSKPPKQGKERTTRGKGREIVDGSTPQLRLDLYIQKFQRQVREKPFSTWTTKELKDIYKQSHMFVVRLEQELKDSGKSLGDVEEISAKWSKHSATLIDELKKREEEQLIREQNGEIIPEGEQVDMNELFLEAVQEAEAEGIETRSIGAASAVSQNEFTQYDTTVYGPPANEARRIADSLKFAGRRELVDLEFLGSVASRITEAHASGGIRSEEAEALFDDVRHFRKILQDAEQAREEDAERKTKEQRERIERERGISERQKELIINDPHERERIFNELFEKADKQPGLQFQDVFNLLIDKPKVDEFIGILLQKGKELVANPATREKGEYFLREAQKYGYESDMRRPIHDVNYAALKNVPVESFAGFVGSFDGRYADLAFEKKGVVAAIHFYEKAMIQVREENGGYLPVNDVVGDVERGDYGRVENLARERLKEAVERGLLTENIYSEHDDNYGEIVGQRAITSMEQWEVDRAFSFAKGMGIITGRFVEIAASSITPKGLSKLTSLYCANLIPVLAPFRHMVARFDIGKEANRALAMKINQSGLKLFLPWVYRQLDVEREDIHAMVNGLMEHDKRLFGVVNFFRLGGIFSQSSWRVQDEKTGELTASLLGDMLNKPTEAERDYEREWIGTGITIEKARGKLESEDKLSTPEIVYGHTVRTEREKADLIVRHNLRKIATRLPLQLFMNVPSVREKVLRAMAPSYGGGRLTKENAQLQEDIKELSLLEEYATINREETLDFDRAQGARGRVEALARAIRDAFDHSEEDHLVHRLADPETEPFIFGSADIPHNLYKYSNIGGNGIGRRWSDLKDGDTGLKALTGEEGFLQQLAHYKTREDVVKGLTAVFRPLANADRGNAEEVVMRLAEAAMKFYSKDFFSTLPLGLGTAWGVLRGKASFAQAVLGRGQMAWDETQLNEFTRLLRDGHLIDEEKQHKLQRLAGGTRLGVFIDVFRSVAPLILIALMYYILSNALKEK